MRVTEQSWSVATVRNQTLDLNNKPEAPNPKPWPPNPKPRGLNPQPLGLQPKKTKKRRRARVVKGDEEAQAGYAWALGLGKF